MRTCIRYCAVRVFVFLAVLVSACVGAQLASNAGVCTSESAALADATLADAGRTWVGLY